MNRFIFVGLIFTIYLIEGCNLVELDQGLGNSGEGAILGPRSKPASVDQIQNILHGANLRTWSAYSFTLMGMSGFQTCRLDDVIIFMQDGSYQYDGGNMLCGAEDNQRIKSGLWEISDNLDLIFHENEQVFHIGEILGLVQDTLVLRGSYLGLEVKGLYLSK